MTYIPHYRSKRVMDHINELKSKLLCLPDNISTTQKKVYISIPITGMVEESRKRAEELEHIISIKNYIPVNPYKVKTCKNPKYADFICDDLRVMLDCDYVLFT